MKKETNLVKLTSEKDVQSGQAPPTPDSDLNRCSASFKGKWVEETLSSASGPVLQSSTQGTHGWGHIAFDGAHLIGAIRANQASFIVYFETLWDLT